MREKAKISADKLGDLEVSSNLEAAKLVLKTRPYCGYIITTEGYSTVWTSSYNIRLALSCIPEVNKVFRWPWIEKLKKKGISSLLDLEGDVLRSTNKEIVFSSQSSQYRFLCLSYPCNIKFRSRVFPSAEFLYYYQLVIDSKLRSELIEGKPNALKKAKEEAKLKDPKLKKKALYRANFEKFTQHPHLLNALLRTGKRKLIYVNRQKHKEGFFLGVNPQGTIGKNALGEILMKLREELKTTPRKVKRGGDK